MKNLDSIFSEGKQAGRDFPLFILEGNGTSLNRGCEAILRSTVKIIDNAFTNCRYINSPMEGAIGLDVQAVNQPNLVHLLASTPTPFGKIVRRVRRMTGLHEPLPFRKFLKEATAILLLGGDNLSLDYHVPDRHFHIMNQVRQAGIPLIVWGASIGPFSKRPDLERYYLQCLGQATLICARETFTQQYLAQHGVSENVVLVADPAFVLEAEICKLSQRLEDALDEGAVGINLSPLLAKYQSRSDSLWVQKAIDLVRAVDRVVDSPIVLVPHVLKPKNNDYDFLAIVLSSLGETKNSIHLLGSELNASQLKWVIGRLRFFIGARTHSTIAALSSCVPTISIGYSVKAQGINHDIFGHLNWLISLEELSAERLSEVVCALNDQLSAVKQELTSKMPAYQERSWNAGVLLRNRLQIEQS